jgi:hypothetical protein
MNPRLGKCQKNSGVYLFPVKDERISRILPSPLDEVVGVFHIKAYIVDDELILSGANLSEEYFSNRLDRYMLFTNGGAGLVDFYANLCDILCDYATRYDGHSENMANSGPMLTSRHNEKARKRKLELALMNLFHNANNQHVQQHHYVEEEENDNDLDPPEGRKKIAHSLSKQQNNNNKISKLYASPKSMLAASSSLPPAESRALEAASGSKPRAARRATFSGSAAAAAAAAGAAAAAPPSVPAAAAAAPPFAAAAAPEEAAAAPSSALSASFSNRSDCGISCSDRNGRLAPSVGKRSSPPLPEPPERSMLHWKRRNMSNPNRKGMDSCGVSGRLKRERESDVRKEKSLRKNLTFFL